MNSKKSNDSHHSTRTPIREVNKQKFQTNDSPSQKRTVPAPEYVSHKDESNQSSPTSIQKLLSLGVIILIFIVLIVGVYFTSTTFSNNSEVVPDIVNENNNSVDQTTNLLNYEFVNETQGANETTILVIENSNCEFCQVDDINQDINEIFESINSSTNYSFKKINMSTNSSQRVISFINNASLEYEFTPLYVFPSQVEEVEAFSQELFNSLFIKVENSSNYILDSQNIGVRYLNEQFDVPNSTIQIGNVDATPITIMNDYWCRRCQIINGDVLTITQAQEEGTISQNYSAPVSSLLLAIRSANSADNLSFHINYIPAPTSQESEQLQVMNYCAHEQNKFLELHVVLVDVVKNAREPVLFNNSQISQISQAAGLDITQFEECLNSQEAQDFKNEMNLFLEEEQITSLPLMVVGNYPLLEIIDEQILSLLLQSENQVFN